MKTENLAIVFTDIVGYTHATATQSREANRKLVQTHNDLLLPIVGAFQGRHIKSIGDALLLAFNSPTDAMLCAMAMQDALHEYNHDRPAPEQIHIRIAASLGEVRVDKHDLFGEAVNVASRIEKETPPDEVYFSESLYLAMNKAEVPAHEVGTHELKGVPHALKLYAIPRFANLRLVPDSQDLDSAVNFPFGGMHKSLPKGGAAIGGNLLEGASSFRWVALAAGFTLVALALYVILRMIPGPPRRAVIMQRFDRATRAAAQSSSSPSAPVLPQGGATSRLADHQTPADYNQPPTPPPPPPRPEDRYQPPPPPPPRPEDGRPPPHDSRHTYPERDWRDQTAPHRAPERDMRW